MNTAGLGLADGNLASSRLLNGSLGRSFSLPVHIPWADPLILTWDFRNSSAGKKIQICTKALNNPEKCSNEFGQRIRLNLTDYSLEIQSLTKSDQGWYEVNARSEQNVHVEVMELRVYEPVSIPTIEVTNVPFSETCNISLQCSAENGSNLTYSWWTGGEEVGIDKLHSVTNDGRRLQMFVYPNSTNRAYNCTVRNPVSEATYMITLEPHCKQGQEKKEVVEPLHIGLIIAAITIFICVLLVIFYVQKKKKHSKFSEGSPRDIYVNWISTKGSKVEEFNLPQYTMK
ncbi:signaling lymphocytic activation molecule-like isoform X2 [Rhincodon typus]|uniref:signaling lymphocytic activation molecule-like isoform X2 n=1 Tax=Rhincodon typus TaxID=259920 RepID=UPI00202F29A6|nr:signaling lymphocytic activation molecule-like isoform X2 [Rhincodon typus]